MGLIGMVFDNVLHCPTVCACPIRPGFDMQRTTKNRKTWLRNVETLCFMNIAGRYQPAQNLVR